MTPPRRDRGDQPDRADPDPAARVRVAVVYGGRSHEHGVSVVSAGSVLAALDPARYDVVQLGITPEGHWVVTESDPAELRVAGRTHPHVAAGRPVLLTADPTGDALVARTPPQTPATGRALGDVDVVFPVLHGRYGEDGTLQGLLELAGVPYVGSGVFASAAAMDKQHSKTLLRAAGLDVGEFVVARRGHLVPTAEIHALGLPVFVKPARAGSSVGISRVSDWADLDAALRLAFDVDEKVLVEAAVTGREIEVGVLADEAGDPVASPLAEIRLRAGFEWYDFAAKYLDDACEFDIPARLPTELTERVQDVACRAFTALDCAGLARVDFFVTADGRVIVNEVNTLPGFTPISLFPKVWAAAGIDYPDLVDRLIRVALRSHS